MGANTKIEWATHTYNPWWGCEKVSPACGLPIKGRENEPHGECYAKVWAQRCGYSETGSKFPIWGKDTARRFFGDAHWSEPLKWEREAEKSGERPRVFCGSMCDVMEDRKDLDIWRNKLYHLIEHTPHLDWLLLTKRPQNFRRFLPQRWHTHPRPNVWGMTTVESQKYTWRIVDLLQAPFLVRGLSIEPLLGPIDLTRVEFNPGGSGGPVFIDALRGRSVTVGGDGELPRIDWVIVGGESGPGARAMHPDWVRSLRDQCASAGVAFHFKQWGTWWPISRTDGIHELPLGKYDPYTPHGFIRQGKKHSGRLLDGVEHNGLPEVARV